MKRLKIVHILKGKANPDTMNGVNKVVHWLATTQQQQGMDVQVWGITDSPDKISHTHDYPLSLFKARAWRFGLCEDLKAAIASAPKDTIFHLHSVFLPELYAVAKHLKKYSLRWIFAPHGGYAPDSRRKNRIPKNIYFRLFESFIVKNAGAIHAIGLHGEADQALLTENTRNIEIIPNAHNTETAQETQEKSKSLPLRVCYCGRMAIAQKGLDLLIESIAITRSSNKEISLELIGDGADRAKLEALAKNLGVSELVRFHGMQTGENKNRIIRSCDVFIHPSRWDVIPTATLEAGALSLPLIVSLPTNMADYVLENNAGYTIEPLDPSSIAKSILIAAEDKASGKLSEKGASAHSMILNKFSWENTSNMLYEKIYLPISMAKHETI